MGVKEQVKLSFWRFILLEVDYFMRNIKPKFKKSSSEVRDFFFIKKKKEWEAKFFY